jgi:hypothetical protein
MSMRFIPKTSVCFRRVAPGFATPHSVQQLLLRSGFNRQLESCYLFQHHFCRIYQPQEKGHVENAVEYVRNNFMVPLPEFADFAAFNESLERQCREQFGKTSAMQEKTIGELFDEEKVSLLPLPATDFETRRTEIHTADSLSLVRFDRNDYSVPGEHVHKEFTVIGSIDTVRFLADGGVVAEHQRDWEVKKTHYNPIHYLSIAERRPNGLDFGAPFAAWHLPDSFDVLRRRLEEQAGKQGKREYIRILRLLEHFAVGGGKPPAGGFLRSCKNENIPLDLFYVPLRSHETTVKPGDPLRISRRGFYP